MNPVEKRRMILVKMLEESGATGVQIQAATGIPSPNLSQMKQVGGRVVTERTLRKVAEYLKRDPSTGDSLGAVPSHDQSAELRTIVLAQTQLILDLSKRLAELSDSVSRLVRDRTVR